MRLVVDTGPLVALLDRRDPLHDWAVETFEELPPPYFTCDAVLTEVSHFLGSSEALRSAWSAGELVVEFDSQKHHARINALLSRYAPMDFADACLVMMAELKASTVITIDRNDFLRYRINGRTPLRTIMPPATGRR